MQTYCFLFLDKLSLRFSCAESGGFESAGEIIHRKSYQDRR